MHKQTFIAENEDAGMRLDRFLAQKNGEYSREKLREVFDRGDILVNGICHKPSLRIKAGDCIEALLPEKRDETPLPENIPIDIVYEDEDVCVVDKKQGMVVHPGAGNFSGTLVNALLYRVSPLSTLNGVQRPGIVHRIDRDTSGLLVVAKTDRAHEALSKQFFDHTITRQYLAVVHGTFENPKGIVNAPIGRDPKRRTAMTVTMKNSKHAVTHYECLKAYDGYSFMRFQLETGRTHQIRVHMKYISHPVIGDRLYGRKDPLDVLFAGQLLHACRLGFIHPVSGRYLSFESPLPEYFNKLL